MQNPSSSGTIAPIITVRIIGDNGDVLGANERGELQVRGVTVFEKYWNNEEATKIAFDRNFWMKTGDVAIVSPEGLLFIVDRIKDMVIRGGENIASLAVEYAIEEFPNVIEVAVYSIPDERLGEEVGATVYSKEKLEEASLRKFLENKLAKYEIPRYFRFTDSPLPRTATAKIFKKSLREDHIKIIQSAKSKL